MAHIHIAGFAYVEGWGGGVEEGLFDYQDCILELFMFPKQKNIQSLYTVCFICSKLVLYYWGYLKNQYFF